MQPFVADITMYQSIWPLAMCLNRPHPTTHYPSGYLAGYVCVCPKRTVQPRFGLTVCRLSELGAICTAATLVIFKAGICLVACSAIALCDVVSLRFHVLLEIPLCFFSLYEYELLVGIKIVPKEMEALGVPACGCSRELSLKTPMFHLCHSLDPTPCADGDIFTYVECVRERLYDVETKLFPRCADIL